MLTFYPRSRWVDDSLLLMGKAFYWKEDYAKAARKFEELTANFPKSKFAQEATYWRGLALWKMGRNSQARRLLETLAENRRSALADNALLTLAEMAFEEEDYQRVAALCQRGLTDFNKSEVRDQTWLLLGRARFALREYDVAADAFVRAITRRSARSLEYEALFMRAQSVKEQGRCSEAMALFAKLAETGQFAAHAPELEMEVADCFVRLGDLDAAAEHYGAVAESYPKSAHSAEALYRLGYLYETRVKDLDKARSFYEKAKAEPAKGEAADKAAARAKDLALLRNYLSELAPFLRSRTDRATQAPLDTLSAAQALGDTTRPADQDTVSSLQGAPGGATLSEPSLSRSDSLIQSTPPVAGQQRDDSTTPGTLLLLAELHLFRFEQPDSALKYYQYVVDEFPGDTLAPRVHYAIGWVQAEALRDSLAARTTFEQIVERYPDTEYARSAQERLAGREAEPAQGGVQDPAAQEFLSVEAMRLGKADPSAYLPRLERLARDYPKSPYAPQAAYVVAWTYDHVLQDSAKAQAAYARLEELFPDTDCGALAGRRLENMLRREEEQASVSAAPGALQEAEESQRPPQADRTKLETASEAAQSVGMAAPDSVSAERVGVPAETDSLGLVKRPEPASLRGAGDTADSLRHQSAAMPHETSDSTTVSPRPSSGDEAAETTEHAP